MPKIVDLLKKTSKPLFSFELLPPPKGQNIKSVFATIDKLMEYEPSNINITYHQEEVIYKTLDNGLLEKRSIRKRPGTVAISAAIKCKYPNATVVPHLICGGFTKEDTEYALIDLHFLDIQNLLVLRGDPPKTSKLFKAEKGGHKHASELIKQIKKMNNGIYLDDQLENTTTTDFSIGVAGYPEKHVEATNMEDDIEFLKQKVDLGAEYIVTQMFFDNQKYFDFVRRCRDKDIKAPIVPGLKPIARLNDINLLPKTFNIDLPEALTKELRKCKSNQDVFKVGVEWGIHQSRELAKHNVPALHYFTIGQADNIKAIAKEVF